MYCDTDQYCAYNSIYSFIGCCSDPITTVSASSTITVSAKSCPVWTTCFDSTESALFSTDDGYTLYWYGTAS
ncbi:hypothetical protein CONLIGDRAFT_631805 [Coniochaeta ligniaria NRRL 30616]|uniref:Uncharacterized protein n=1 Tax=Coniochaeta ligniaria NRRL 30616 TaxID=1408157 RepID=A0A1J7IQV2_9PEZI|nr:hypothetical protein CONLIGDRAFT_631805 [Coniochaeta ligniaria NRRL 30616]